MSKSKGMSQTLALIVAASVLMMTALTVIFLAQGSLTSFGEDSKVTSCESAVNAKCNTALRTSTNSEATVGIPNSCMNSDGSLVVGSVGSHDLDAGTGEVECGTSGDGGDG